MKSGYQPTKFFRFLGYGPGNGTYRCPGMRSLSVFCRGRREQLEALLEPTPFELRDDRFLVSVADFSNVVNSRGSSDHPYYDAALVLPVRYGDVAGGSYYFEWENDNWQVISGRELWGYPKHFAAIEMIDGEFGVQSRVSLGDQVHLTADLIFDGDTTNEAWSDTAFYPHLQVRAVPQINGPGFDSLDIITRNTSLDYELLERRRGRANVTLGESLRVGGERLEIVEVLGGEYSVGNFASTGANGTPTIVASLI